MGTDRRLRPSARVIVVDDDGHVFLFRCDDPGAPEEEEFWLTPGGGAEPAEELRATAARELFEEVGLRVDAEELIGPVAVCEGDWTFRGEPIHSLDTYFVARVPRFEVDRSGNEVLEAEIMFDHAWWHPDDLDNCEQRVIPYGLAQLVRDIHAGHTFDTPRALPW